MLTLRARVYREWIAAPIYQQIKKSHYNRYLTDLACSVRIGEILVELFFARLMDLASGSVQHFSEQASTCLHTRRVYRGCVNE